MLTKQERNQTLVTADSLLKDAHIQVVLDAVAERDVQLVAPTPPHADVTECATACNHWSTISVLSVNFEGGGVHLFVFIAFVLLNTIALVSCIVYCMQC